MQAQLDPALADERSQPLSRVITRFPDPVLESLCQGLIKNQDKLVMGKLWSGDGSGCAVGLLLCELFPRYWQAAEERSWKRWLPGHGRSVRKEYHSLSKEIPHLPVLESIFDRTVILAEQHGMTHQQALQATGAWLLDAVKEEIALRHDKARQGLLPPDWQPSAPKSDAASQSLDPVAG
jgi:hypothetical protein